jgi:hypothetical protein
MVRMRELDTYRGICEFKKSYQPRINLVKDESVDLLADSHIMNGWKNLFSQLLNVHKVGDVRQMEIHTAEPLVPEPSPFKVEPAIRKLKRYKSLGNYQIPAELASAGDETLRSKIHIPTNSFWNKEELPQHWIESINIPIYKGDKTDRSNCGISTL